MLLLNTVLTVRAHKANSHRKQGWETFTDAVIEALAKREDPLVFILWGTPAKKKKKLITRHGDHHAILESGHPSPLSIKHFRDSKPFSRTNAALEGFGVEPIDWSSD